MNTLKNKPIYVEIPIQGEMDELWDASQRPDLHEQWDLRFSSITYLPKETDEPQRFTYKTNVGFGLSVEGWGKSVGSFHGKDDARMSSLNFGTDQSISIIREGRGYWKYIPEVDSSITFLTQYDYKTNFGRVGELVDRFMFRPLMGWATALSFDVLKRWLEKGDTPASQYMKFFSYWIITFLFSFIWMYHGLVPKIIAMHPAELSLMQNVIPISTDSAVTLTAVIGVMEVVFGFIWLFYRNKRHLFGLQLIAFPFLGIGAIVSDPSFLLSPFNPLTFNLALLVLSIVGFITSKDIPTGKSCKRKRD